MSNWDILELRSQKFEIISFSSFLNSLVYGALNPKNYKKKILNFDIVLPCRTHLDDFLKVRGL